MATTLDVTKAVVAVASLVLAVFGYFGWKSQVQGKSRHDVARAVLLCAYRICTEIRDIRVESLLPPPDHDGPDTFHITVDSYKLENPDDPLRAFLTVVDNLYGPCRKRLKKLTAELDLARFEAWTLWGDKSTPAVLRLLSLVSEFRDALTDYSMVRGMSIMAPDSTPPDAERLRRAWLIIVSPPSEGDPFGEKMQTALSDIESWYRREGMLT